MRGGDGLRALFAIGLAPARGEPRRGIVIERRGAGEIVLALAREIAQHAIDERGIGRRLRVEPRHPHGKIDGRVIRHVEKQNLRGRRGEAPFDLRRRARQAAVEQIRQSISYRAETAQRGGDDRARQGKVARIEPADARQAGAGSKKLVEHMAIGDDIPQYRRCGYPGGKAGDRHRLLARECGGGTRRLHR